jgi:para-nitrobenzyl esterase
MYYFDWRSPVRGGKLRSMHCMELPFVFDHPDLIGFMTGNGPERIALARNMAAAWVAFARDGNPSHSGIPRWAPFTVSTRATMVFDENIRLVNDPWGEERRAMAAIRARSARPA